MHAAGDAVVVADDRVLHRVRQRQQDDQIERIELRQLPLAGEPQPDDQEGVDQDRPQDLLGDRQRQREHVVPHLRLHGRHYPAAMIVDDIISDVQRRGAAGWPALAALAALGSRPHAAPCRPPPYPLAFSLDAASPRLLETSQEIAVPVTLGNSGVRAWDPARIHLSYHWLWLVPRELVASLANGAVSRRHPDRPRARRRSRRAAASRCRDASWRRRSRACTGCSGTWWRRASPGSRRWRRASRARSSSSCRRRRGSSRRCRCSSRSWGLFALADAGRGNRRWSAAIAWTSWWCAATLAAKPLILAHAALLEPTAVAYWLILAVAVVVPLLGLLILPRRVRPWVLLAIGIFCSLLILADVVYYRFFGDVLSTPAMLAARQTGHVWGSIGSLFTPGLVWLRDRLAVRLLARRHGCRARPRRTGRRSRARGRDRGGDARWRSSVSAAVVAVPRALASTPLDQMFRARSVVEQLGPFGYHAYDTWNYARSTWLRPPATAAQVDDAVAWLRERAPLRAGGAGVRRGARQESDRRAGGVAAGLRRRFHRRRPGGDAAPAPVDRATACASPTSPTRPAKAARRTPSSRR